MTDINDHKLVEESPRASEMLFKRAFQDADIGMTLASLDSVFFEVNDAFCEMLGYERDELIGMSFPLISHPDDRAESEALRAGALEGLGDSIHASKRYIHKNGDIIRAQVSASLVRDLDGEPLYFVSQIQDVTASKFAEEERTTLEGKLHQAHQVEKVRLEVTQKAILNILDDFGDERERQGDSQRAVLNILEDIDADKIRLEATQKAILNILDDFGVERRNVEEANADLQAVNEAMRSFVAVAAHDLRSPLTSIVGFSTLLTENWAAFSEEDRQKFVATIDHQSQNLVRLVDDLLTLSNIESGVLNTRPELIALVEAIHRCLEVSGGDTASVLVSCSPDLVVRVDPSHLARILDNYLQNAFKYGEPPVRIEAIRVGDVIEVRVLDHGPGVPPEFVSRLFGKFARADTPGTRTEKGVGLGLSIVRGLAEANGGQVRYEPNAPTGACFVVGLPAGDRPNG